MAPRNAAKFVIFSPLMCVLFCVLESAGRQTGSMIKSRKLLRGNVLQTVPKPALPAWPAAVYRIFGGYGSILMSLLPMVASQVLML